VGLCPDDTSLRSDRYCLSVVGLCPDDTSLRSDHYCLSVVGCVQTTPVWGQTITVLVSWGLCPDGTSLRSWPLLCQCFGLVTRHQSEVMTITVSVFWARDQTSVWGHDHYCVSVLGSWPDSLKSWPFLCQCFGLLTRQSEVMTITVSVFWARDQTVWSHDHYCVSVLGSWPDSLKSWPLLCQCFGLMTRQSEVVTITVSVFWARDQTSVWGHDHYCVSVLSSWPDSLKSWPLLCQCFGARDQTVWSHDHYCVSVLSSWPDSLKSWPLLCQCFGTRDQTVWGHCRYCLCLGLLTRR
jgi:hypothetical protein